MKTQVAIIGAGPSGLLLGHLMRASGIDAVVVERASADYVLGRIRAGVLEKTTVDLVERLGLDERLQAEGLCHDGFSLADGERLIRIDLADLVNKHVTVYGQTELTRDLMEACDQRSLEVIYEVSDVAIHDHLTDRPYLTYTAMDGTANRIDAEFICGCDGFHGVSRKTIEANSGNSFERVYPFGWLGILADVPPCDPELIYANHTNGFALASMRSESRSRYYIQVPLDETLEEWPDERFWDELATRLGPGPADNLVRGPSIEKSIAPLRSYVFDTMREGRLLLLGDSAHIVPPTGAKGLNLAASDVHYASAALVDYFLRNDRDGVGDYSRKALSRVWKSERFSWSLTKLMHRFPDDSRFEQEMQRAELDYIATSRAAQTSIAENYVGLPV